MVVLGRVHQSHELHVRIYLVQGLMHQIVVLFLAFPHRVPNYHKQTVAESDVALGVEQVDLQTLQKQLAGGQVVFFLQVERRQ